MRRLARTLLAVLRPSRGGVARDRGAGTGGAPDRGAAPDGTPRTGAAPDGTPRTGAAPDGTPRTGGTPLPSGAATPDLRTAPCLDVRPLDALALALVPGSIVLPASDAARLAGALPDGLVVLAASDTVAATLAEQLRAAGRVAFPSAGGILAWKAAGRVLREPAWKSPLPPGHAVRLYAADAAARGLPARDLPGWVQDVAWRELEFRYDVRVEADGALISVGDLPEEALAAQAGRGAAGLGAVVGG